jgi:hypothetical protein
VAKDANNNNNWDMFKDHFIQAYSANQAALTVTHGGYHGAANATDDYPDNDSLESIPACLASLQMANNASVQATNDQLSNLTANTQQQFAQLAQQMAMLATQAQQMHSMPPPYAHVQHADIPPPSTDGATATYANQRPGIHTITTTCATNQTNDLRQKRTSTQRWKRPWESTQRTTHCSPTQHYTWQLPRIQ